MKKSGIAIAVLAVVGAAWVGGAWYTGKTIEQEYGKLLLEVTQKNWGNPSLALQAKIENYQFERGLFTSTARYDFVMDIGNEHWVLPYESKIYHGPLPLNTLAQFNLKPMALSAQDQVVKNDHTQAWFDYANGKNPLTIQYDVDYQKNIKGKALFNPAQISFGGEHSVSWTEGKYEFEGTVSLINKFSTELANLQFNLKDKPTDNITIINLDNISIESDLKETAWKNLPQGEQIAKIGNVAVTSQNTGLSVQYKNWDMTSAMKLDDKLFDFLFESRMEKVLLGNQDMGELTIKVKGENLEAEALDKSVTISQGGEELSDEESIALLKQLLQHQAKFEIDPLKLKNSKGEAKAELDLQFAHSDFDNMMPDDLLGLFKHLKLNINVDKEALLEAYESIVKVQSGNDRLAISREVLEQDIDYLIEEFVQKEAITFDGKVAKLDLRLEKGELTLNGTFIPKEQAMTVLFLMMIGLSQ